MSRDTDYRKRDRAVEKLLAVLEKEKAGRDAEDDVSKAIDELALAQITVTRAMNKPFPWTLNTDAVKSAAQKQTNKRKAMMPDLVDDEAWFKKHPECECRVRRVSNSERWIAGRAANVAIVTQMIRPSAICAGSWAHRYLTLPTDLVEYVIRNGEDCLIDGGAEGIVLPGCMVKGKVLQ
jgi:hypothetical protein